MRGPIDAYALRKRVDAVTETAGALSLSALPPGFREEAALVEIHALDVRYRLRAQDRHDDPQVRARIEGELDRLERRCAELSRWLRQHGRDAQTDATPG